MQTEIETFCPASRQAWRLWLNENHLSKQSVWLVYYKKKSAVPTIAYSDAVDEALCFGWIDSTTYALENDTYRQYFCKRKIKSSWSKVNKGKIQRLIEEGLMTEAGYKSIEIAKQNGSWTILDDVEELNIPKDLEIAFEAQKGSKDYFLGLSRSVRKQILQWVAFAKRPETRQKRINEIAVLAAQQLKPVQFR